MNKERKVLLDAFTKHNYEITKAINNSQSVLELLLPNKRKFLSEMPRQLGNSFFKLDSHNEETHRQIFGYYNQSICSAPNNSEDLALAYGNRSAFFLDIRRYEHSIKDIDRALNITKCCILKIKLLCRKVECLKALGRVEHKEVMKKAEAVFLKVDEKNKKALSKLIEKSKACLVKDKVIEKVETEADKSARIAQDLDEKDVAKVLDTIKIDHNEKYGRHLIAKKDFEPGEIVCVEKFALNVLRDETITYFCSNCLKFLWSGIPCENCGLDMFCNEQCREEAWEKFHNIECSFFPLFMTFLHKDKYRIAVRALILAMKENNENVSTLKSIINYIDKDQDIVNRGFVVNGCFKSDTMKSVYSLKSDNIPCNKVQEIARIAMYFLICLAKCTKYLGENFDLKKVEDIKNNEDAIFLGTLFMKFCFVRERNETAIQSLPYFCDNWDIHGTAELGVRACCQRGSFLAPFNALINNDCFSNVRHCFTEDGRVVVYAVRPIKKNEQLLISYTGDFYNNPRKNRKESLKNDYNLNCKCTPCKKNWPLLTEFPLNLTLLDIALFKIINEIGKKLENKDTNFDEETIKSLAKNIKISMNQLDQPSRTTCCLLDRLNAVMNCTYGIRPPIFGECNKASNKGINISNWHVI